MQTELYHEQFMKIQPNTVHILQIMWNISTVNHHCSSGMKQDKQWWSLMISLDQLIKADQGWSRLIKADQGWLTHDDHWWSRWSCFYLVHNVLYLLDLYVTIWWYCNHWCTVVCHHVHNKCSAFVNCTCNWFCECRLSWWDDVMVFSIGFQCQWQ